MNWLLDFNNKTANATGDFIYFSFLSFCFVALGLFLFSRPLFFLLFLSFWDGSPLHLSWETSVNCQACRSKIPD